MTPLTMFITIAVLGILIALCFVYILFANKKTQNQHVEKTAKIPADNKISTNKKIENSNYLSPLPTVFTKKYSNEKNHDNFERDFELNSYKLPDGFIDFCNSDKIYSLGEDFLNLNPLKFSEIIKTAELLIWGSDVFCIPPHCIPFCDDESGGHVYYCLDYNLCGKQGSPRVVCVDNELIAFDNNENVAEYNFKEKVIADSFDEFLKKLKEV